eukprot:COSAG04_NODE_28484_length_275_cov_0.863636_1_plen_28_part_01
MLRTSGPVLSPSTPTTACAADAQMRASR